MLDDDELNTDMFRLLVRAEAGQQVNFDEILGPAPMMDGKQMEWTGKLNAAGEPTLKVVGE